jgi:hypothetical protein
MDSMAADSFPKGLPSGQNDVRGRLFPGQMVSEDVFEVSRWDIEQALAAGIDAFAIWMYPRLGDPLMGGQHGTFKSRKRLEALFTEMRKNGKMKFFPDYWWYKMSPENWVKVFPRGWQSEPMPTIEQEMKRQGEMLRDWMLRFGDVWLQRNGKFVVGMQDHALFQTVPYEKAMAWLFGPMGGRKKIFLSLSRYPLSGTVSSDWLAGADAVMDWDANRSYGESLEERAAGKEFARQYNKEWWSACSPGFSQSRQGDATAPAIPNVYERLGIIAFRQAWLDAIATGVPAVYLITWNDRSEDTEIMPTFDHGMAIQRLTAFFSRWFHQGKTPDIDREELLLFHHPQVVEKLELPLGRQPSASPDWCLTPPTDYVALCSFLRTPAEISVYFQKKCVATRMIPAGFHTWLLYHPARKTNGAAVYPREDRSLSVTVLPEAFSDAEVAVKVSRPGQEAERFFSHLPIVSAAGRADLGTVGDVFVIKSAKDDRR